ncbi:MAG: glycosyltransferase [Pseudanabaenaceae cyanobacterium]
MVWGFLLLYGFNAYWLTFNSRPRLARRLAPWQSAPALSAVGRCADRPTEIDLPIVTIQLPIFNERYVAKRLLEAVCNLDYPRDRLYIQVLDDSTDDTQQILESAVAEMQAQGHWVEYFHRIDRRGYKAGALQDAMPYVQGEYIAIFDADFVPEPDWLKRTIAHFLANPDQPIAVVQTRWGHLNSEYSFLTKVQSTMMDGHFVIEEQCRYLQDYFLIFHGTAGIWNKRAILEAGGWTADTLAEDMDLSYRAQLLGWKIIYDNDIVAPAELPVTISAFKLQQFRWNKGIAQCAKKFLWRVWRSRQSLMVKLQATLHLTCCFPILLSLLVAITALPTVLTLPEESPQLRIAFDSFWGLAMTPVTFGWPILYAMGQKRLYPRTWYRRLLRVLGLMVVATGLSLNNSRAVFAGILNTGATFQRTPKFAIKQKHDRWTDKVYKLPFDIWSVVELIIGIYSGIALGVAIAKGLYTVIPFTLLTTAGFLYVGGLSIWQVWQQRREQNPCGQ